MVSHDTHSRAIVPESLAACAIDDQPSDVLLGRNAEFWMRYFIKKHAKDETDRRFLLAVLLGDPYEDIE